MAWQHNMLSKRKNKTKQSKKMLVKIAAQFMGSGQ